MDHHGANEHPKECFEVMINLPFHTKREGPMLSLSPCRLLGFKMPNLATEELNSHENHRPLSAVNSLPEMNINLNIPIEAPFLSVPSGSPQYLSEVYQVLYR